jgi:DNA-binding PadR family transcriptional regulator
MNEELLRELLMAAKDMDAQPVEPSPRAKERLEAMLAKYAPAVITEAQMKILILKILSGRADGGEVADELTKLKVNLQTPGRGLVFALLDEMESEGMIRGEFNVDMTRKSYRLTDRGSGLLERDANTVQGLSPLVAALWAV